MVLTGTLVTSQGLNAVALQICLAFCVQHVVGVVGRHVNQDVDLALGWSKLLQIFAKKIVAVDSFGTIT